MFSWQPGQITKIESKMRTGKNEQHLLSIKLYIKNKKMFHIEFQKYQLLKYFSQKAFKNHVRLVHRYRNSHFFPN